MEENASSGYSGQAQDDNLRGFAEEEQTGLQHVGCSKCDSSDSDEVARYTYCPDTPSADRRRTDDRASAHALPDSMSSDMFASKGISKDGCFVGQEFERIQSYQYFTESNRSHDESCDVTNGKQPQVDAPFPEYVKRTARLFEKASNGTNGTNGTNGFNGTKQKNSPDRELIFNSPDKSKDADSRKKPSYLGVSCSNSGYRNVINYDSKLRQGLRSSRGQRESLVLSSSRLRDSSPLKCELEVRQNGTQSHESHATHLNGVGSAFGDNLDKFVNISTSTKTISTFRTCGESCVQVTLEKTSDASNASEEPPRRSLVSRYSENLHLDTVDHCSFEESSKRNLSSRYSDLGFSSKNFRSPEKNCTSFLRSINSFEKNMKKSEKERPDGSSGSSGSGASSGSSYDRVRAETDEKSSIQQRIERLYGPAALAQGFYFRKPSWRTPQRSKPFEEPNLHGATLSSSVRVTTESNGKTSPILLSLSKLPGLLTEPAAAEPEPANKVAEPADRGARHFLKLLNAEIEKLDHLASFAENELENGENLPEEASGKLRAAAGKARLLIRQKLHQFEGLCHKNMNEKPDEKFPTTSDDLAGFWDMVMLQIVQVYGVFDEIEQLKKNDWHATSSKCEDNNVSPPNTTKKVTRKSVSAQSNNEKTEKTEAVKRAREETRRKMMEERRKQMKELKENKNINNDSEIEIYAK